MKVFLLLTIVFVSVYAVQDIQKCKDGSPKALEDEIYIKGCDKPPCLLKRKSIVDVVIKFKPDRDAKQCTTSVFGIIGGIPLPFIGVDNTDCCPFIYNSEGEKVGCPMKAGESYEYRNVINVLQIYPKINVLVEWQLLNNKQNLKCFQVDAKIVS